MYEQRFVKSKNDHESCYTSPILSYDWIIETEAADIFTRVVFLDVRREIGCAIHKCMSVSFHDANGLKKFKIVDTSVISMEIDESIDRVKDPTYFDEFFPTESEVVYNSNLEDVYCSCRRYERFGLLWRHIYYALCVLKVGHFPSKYICKGWTKNVVPRTVCLNVCSNIATISQELGLSDYIRRVYYNVDMSLEKVIGNKEKLLKFLKAQEYLLHLCEAYFEACDRMSNKDFISQMLGVKQSLNIEVHARDGIHNKGCVLRKRIRSSKEKAIAISETKSRKCGYCGSYDPHNIRSCPARLEAEAAEKTQAHGG